VKWKKERNYILKREKKLDKKEKLGLTRKIWKSENREEYSSFKLEKYSIEKKIQVEEGGKNRSCCKKIRIFEIDQAWEEN